jgi:anti-sigma factor RsiW
MQCTIARKGIKALLHGELNPAEQQALQEHLAGCQPCRQEAGRLSRTWGLLLALEEEAAVPSLVPGVLERIRHEQSRPFAGAMLAWLAERRPTFAAATCAAMLAGFVVGAVIAQATSKTARSEALPAEGQLYLESFSDVPASSPAGAYLEFIDEGGE